MQKNTLFTGDNLYILQGMDSESVDLIYLDPPFNSKRNFAAPVGSKSAGSKFKDIWKWSDVDEILLEQLFDKHPSLASFIQVIDVVHSKAMMAYISFMALRLLELHRVLKPTGSVYLHCDSTASHYLKGVMDTIFGTNNFHNEIIWQRNSSRGKGSQFAARKFGANTDTIFFYTKTKDYYLNAIPEFDLDDADVIKKFNKMDEKGRRYNTTTPIFRAKTMGARPNLCFKWRGYTNPHPSGWRLSKERLEEEYQKGNIVFTDDKLLKGSKIERRQYLDDYKGTPLDNNWTDIPRVSRKESTGYPTQKPLALLHRIVKASSKKDDLVLDPFCGCATTCVAAQQLHRRWIGIDIEKNAANIVVERLEDVDGFFENFMHRDDVPYRTDIKEKRADSESVKSDIYKQQNGKCNGCREDFKAWNLEVDHIIPKAKGGGNYVENYQLLCGNCNRIKGDRPMEYLMTKIRARDAAMAKVSFGSADK